MAKSFAAHINIHKQVYISALAAPNKIEIDSGDIAFFASFFGGAFFINCWLLT